MKTEKERKEKTIIQLPKTDINSLINVDGYSLSTEEIVRRVTLHQELISIIGDMHTWFEKNGQTNLTRTAELMRRIDNALIKNGGEVTPLI